MKKIILALALAFTTVLAFTNPAYAAKDVYLTTAVGYQLAPSNTKKHQQNAFGYSQDDHGTVSIAVGTRVAENVIAQLEYVNVKAAGNVATDRTDQENFNVVGLVPVAQLNDTASLYALGGVGFTSVDGSGVHSYDSAQAIIGGGLDYRLNKSVSVIGEVRTNYDLKHNYWQPQAAVGIRVGLF